MRAEWHAAQGVTIALALHSGSPAFEFPEPLKNVMCACDLRASGRQ